MFDVSQIRDTVFLCRGHGKFVTIVGKFNDGDAFRHPGLHKSFITLLPLAREKYLAGLSTYKDIKILCVE
jgi:hypothetical protein